MNSSLLYSNESLAGSRHKRENSLQLFVIRFYSRELPKAQNKELYSE